MESVADRLGGNVRRLRGQAGLTLVELSRSTGLAKGTLAAIEQGRGNPTIETLDALTEGLNTTMSDLIGDGARAGSRVLRKSEAPRSHGAGYEASLLSRIEGGGTVVELCTMDFEAHGHVVCTPSPPGSRQEMVVTEGRLRAGPENDTVDLDAGDYVSFAADVPYLFEALGDEPATFVLVMRLPTPSFHADALGGTALEPSGSSAQ